ncbi:unnamed protein product [Rotaria sp. Silwood2]|nr:unnamed protein product [Rotaria sp. Silwood2]CAF4209509.1 unnamed protein product [Rotaria sp. Silwood2]CAF4219271.1 unnamed protein product [Rotaria sp. Silwood2]
MFKLVYNSIRLNQLVVDGATNVGVSARVVNGSWAFRYAPKTFRYGASTCSCGSSSSCQKPQGFFCRNVSCLKFNAQPNRTIPGMFLGCFPIDSILLSTLECLYDQSCIQMLIDSRSFDFSDIVVVSDNLTNITALNQLAPSRFLPNTSLETIISQLFMENWTTSVNFSAYFAQCQPDSCIYTLGEIDTLNEKYQAHASIESRWSVSFEKFRSDLSTANQQRFADGKSVTLDKFTEFHWHLQLYIENGLGDLKEKRKYSGKISKEDNKIIFVNIVI